MSINTTKVHGFNKLANEHALFLEELAIQQGEVHNPYWEALDALDDYLASAVHVIADLEKGDAVIETIERGE